MKIIFILVALISSVSADDNVEIGFRYGLLGRVESKPDSTVVLSDSSIISHCLVKKPLLFFLHFGVNYTELYCLHVPSWRHANQLLL